tara:strand:- start:143 stop:289 length:147 start_codon:yes stop_codon:yes gene_type:complete
MKCFCGKELLLNGDHDSEDYYIIVSNLSCQNEECEVKTVLVYRDVEEE